jgi:hypothetical protein
VPSVVLVAGSQAQVYSLGTIELVYKCRLQPSPMQRQGLEVTFLRNFPNMHWNIKVT